MPRATADREQENNGTVKQGKRQKMCQYQTQEDETPSNCVIQHTGFEI